jgi:hyaluronan synthase
VIFFTVDRDSIVNIDTLRNLVRAFVKNEECGAVASNISVLNTTKAMLLIMLDVRFVMSFEFVRSTERNLNSVLCTPGTLAAYKTTAIFKYLPEWINQTFMGQPSDIAENSTPTHMILQQGQHVLFNKNMEAYTIAP